MPRFKTLSGRLFLFLAVWLMIAIAVITLLISNIYRGAAETRLDELLTANIFNLMGVVTVDERGAVTGQPQLGDARFSQFSSGWYWSVSPVGQDEAVIRSPSLAGRDLETPGEIPFDSQFQRTFITDGFAGERLRIRETQVFLGDGDTVYSFKVSANLDELEAEIADFTRGMLLLMAALGLGTLLFSYLVLRFGLRPLARATNDLSEIREGRTDRLAGQYPEEIQPLIDETNALIGSNQAVIERARTQVGNLAHSLKTPLAVLQNEAGAKKTVPSNMVVEQITQMRDQIQVYLDRARISARYGTVTSRTDVQETVEKLMRVMQKLNPSIEYETGKGLDAALIFRGEENDLQEMLGNLLENASKFAKSRIRTDANLVSKDRLLITIDDDGPGLDEDQMKEAMGRGKRLDESKPGSGLGLSIVKDIASEYDGDFTLAKSELGGLSAQIELPGQKNSKIDISGKKSDPT